MTPNELGFVIKGEAHAGLLCRLFGLLAARDLQAPALTVSVSGERMTVRMAVADLETRAAEVVERKMAEMVGVSSVRLTQAAAAGPRVCEPAA